MLTSNEDSIYLIEEDVLLWDFVEMCGIYHPQTPHQGKTYLRYDTFASG
jgi:hypothetical protein